MIESKTKRCSVFEVLQKRAAIPRAAMPWMAAAKKIKTPAKVVTTAPQGTKTPLHTKSQTNFATPGGAPALTPKSIKAISAFQPSGKLIRTKLSSLLMSRTSK